MPTIKSAIAHRLRAARTSTAGLRALPDFVIIGAQKAGTTSLYDALARHPHIVPAAKKELRYLADRHTLGEAWYRAQFPLRAQLRGRLTGEASPYYLFHPASPARAAALIPGAVLIVALRDPVERAWSHWNFTQRLGREQPGVTFEQALDLEPSRLAGEENRLLADPGYESWAHKNVAYLARGQYAEQLERWYQHFPRDRVVVVQSEELFASPAPVLDLVLARLGLPPADLAMAALNRTEHDTLDPDTRDRLVEHFRPHNQALYELLGHRFDWPA